MGVSKQHLGVLRVGLVLVCVACAVDLSLPQDAQITCRDNSDCRLPAVCKASIGRCVSTEGDDGRGPELVSADLTPSLVTIDGEVAVTLSTDEALAADPDVRLVSGGPFRVLARDDLQQNYELRYVVKGTEPPGPLAVTAALVDVFGNASDVTIGTVTLDFSAPRLGLAVWDLGARRAVRPGDRITLTAAIDSDATLSAATFFVDDVDVGDVTQSFVVAASDADSVRARGDIVVPESSADGALLTVGFALADAAGNVTFPRAALSPPVPVDALPPQGSFALPTASGSSTVLATITHSDATSVRFAGDLFSPTSVQSPVPASIVLVLRGGTGDKSVTATFEDAAGNSVTFGPVVVSLTLPPGTGSAGQFCSALENCDSLNCACADVMCQSRRCAADSVTPPCTFVNERGELDPVPYLASETQDPSACFTPFTCGPSGACLLGRGQACTAPAECVTGFCECADLSCSSNVCANRACEPCRAGVDCNAIVNNDVPCGSSQVCRVGACVVRSPGTCEAECGGIFVCSGPAITSSSCNAAQGFAAFFTGVCPPSFPCGGSPSCACY